MRTNSGVQTIVGLLVTGAVVGAVATGLMLAVLLWSAASDRSLRPAASASEARVPEPVGPPLSEPPAALRGRRLAMPVPSISRDRLATSFLDPRGGGRRVHHALDILAPRHTPVVSVDEGTVERLDTTGAGGISVYAFDPGRRYCYYYAHLERVADGLAVGQRITRGQLVGYVGTTGNAPANTPHLHFSISEMTGSEDCWRGRPVDPYPLFR